jgi:hypothetical protein
MPPALPSVSVIHEGHGRGMGCPCCSACVAQTRHWVAYGRAARRGSAIGSSQVRQVPYVPSAIRVRAARRAALCWRSPAASGSRTASCGRVDACSSQSGSSGLVMRRRSVSISRRWRSTCARRAVKCRRSSRYASIVVSLEGLRAERTGCDDTRSSLAPWPHEARADTGPMPASSVPRSALQKRIRITRARACHNESSLPQDCPTMGAMLSYRCTNQLPLCGGLRCLYDPWA